MRVGAMSVGRSGTCRVCAWPYVHVLRLETVGRCVVSAFEDLLLGLPPPSQAVLAATGPELLSPGRDGSCSLPAVM